MRILNRLLDGFALLGLLGLAAASAISLLARMNWRFELFVHFRLHYVVLAAVLLTVFLLRRRFLPAALAALLGAANLVGTLPPTHAAMAQIPDGGQGKATQLRVASFNVDYLNSDYAGTFDWLERSKPDLFLLIEVTPKWLAAVPPAIKARYPFQAVRLGDRRRDGMALFSRYPLDQWTVLDPINGYPALLTKITVGGEMVTALGVHPPTPGWPVKLRDRYLSSLAHIVARLPGPVIVAGDFNATPYTYSYRRFLVHSGMPSGPLTAGTWPAAFGFAGVPIDHILAGKGAAVQCLQVGPDLGSDHRPLLAEVSLPWAAPPPSHAADGPHQAAGLDARPMPAATVQQRPAVSL